MQKLISGKIFDFIFQIIFNKRKISIFQQQGFFIVCPLGFPLSAYPESGRYFDY